MNLKRYLSSLFLMNSLIFIPTNKIKFEKQAIKNYSSYNKAENIDATNSSFFFLNNPKMGNSALKWIGELTKSDELYKEDQLAEISKSLIKDTRNTFLINTKFFLFHNKYRIGLTYYDNENYNKKNLFLQGKNLELLLIENDLGEAEEIKERKKSNDFLDPAYYLLKIFFSRLYRLLEGAEKNKMTFTAGSKSKTKFKSGKAHTYYNYKHLQFEIYAGKKRIFNTGELELEFGPGRQSLKIKKLEFGPELQGLKIKNKLRYHEEEFQKVIGVYF